jgi:putative phosphoesterase
VDPATAPAPATDPATDAVARLHAEGALVVGVVSDTHGWLDPRLAEWFAGVDAIVHAGDVGNPGVLDQLRRVAPVHAVRGNIDGGALADLPLELIATWAGTVIGVRHICGSPQRPSRAAERFVSSTQAGVLVFGHSHIPVAVRRHGCLWLNPGAAGNEGFHEMRTAALLVLGPGPDVRVMRIHLGRRGRTA